jgi:hypothetical protein
MEYKERRPKIESYEYEGFGRQIVANACISQQFLITKKLCMDNAQLQHRTMKMQSVND